MIEGESGEKVVEELIGLEKEEKVVIQNLE